MAEIGKPRLAIYVALVLAVLLIGSRFLRGGASGGAEGADAGVPAVTGSTGTTAAAGAPGAPDGRSGGTASSGDGAVVVDVKGSVRRPGVYRLSVGARALDAVRRAGGMTGRADRLGVNLAARVTDGGEVVVPARGGRGGGGAAAVAAGGGGSAGGAGGAGGAGAAAPGQPLSLDLNSATAQELEQLDGVGPATAAKIVAYREQHGGIGSVDELDEVSGIGERRLAAIRAQLAP